MVLQCDFFMIGCSGDDLKLYIDLDSLCIVKFEEGEVGIVVFMFYGGYSDYLDCVVSLFEYFYVYVQYLFDFIEVLIGYQLFEFFVFDIEIVDGQQSCLLGFYIIYEECLVVLFGVVLEKLQCDGYFLFIYMQLVLMMYLYDLVECVVWC